QRLAEEAIRSSGIPFIIVAMLHQGVSAYCGALNHGVRREWDKIAGRFEEIVYVQPLEQVTHLVAATLNVNVHALDAPLKIDAQRSMTKAIRSGLYGSSTAGSLAHLGPNIFPIHPATLPVLTRAIRKLGQNERSLFSFISAAEPMGLQEHIQANPKLEPYRVYHLFDYVRHNLLPSINNGSVYIQWGLIESVLASAPIHNEEEENVLKSVALLNLLAAADLPATEEFLHLALDNGRNLSRVKEVIQSLKKRHVLYDRGTIKEFCLWPHTSVNLDAIFDRALTATRTAKDDVELLCEQLGSTHIVPRGHYFQSGTLRFAEVRFYPANKLAEILANQPILNGKHSDLNICVILPSTQPQLREVQQRLREVRH